jgi:hypothetical protein
MPDESPPQSPSSDSNTEASPEAPSPSPPPKRRSHGTIPPLASTLAGPTGLTAIKRTLGTTAQDAVNISRIADSAFGAGSVAAAMLDAQKTLSAISINLPRMDAYAEVPVLSVEPSPVVGATVDTARATEALLRVSQDQQAVLTGLLVETQKNSKHTSHLFWRVTVPLGLLTLAAAIAAAIIAALH